MPSLLPPLQSRPDALAPARSAPLRPSDPDSGFARELNRSRRTAPQRDAPDSHGAAEEAREPESPPIEPEPQAADAAAAAPVEAQGPADPAQGLPPQSAATAPSANGDTSAAQSGPRPETTGQGPHIQIGTPGRPGGPGGQPGSQGAPGQPAAPGQPGVPAAPQGSDAGAAPPPQTALPGTSAAQPSGKPLTADLTQRAGTDDSAPRLSADPTTARDPAVGRAMQVQAALAVESLTGSAPDPAAAPRIATGDRAVFAGSSTPAAASAPQGAPDASGVVRGLNAMVNHSGGVMTMRLEPPELGQVRVQMTIAQGTVTAHFQPATAEAQALLERALPALRAALEAHGLAAERLTVQSAPQPAPPAREQAQDQPGQERHHQDAGSGESRGRRDGGPHDRPHRGAWHSAHLEARAAPLRSLQGAVR